jgi:glycosyltransferase involved in cell wall biosynthesis
LCRTDYEAETEIRYRLATPQSGHNKRNHLIRMTNISVSHTVSSIESLASGPTYSVTGLARAQSELGATVKLCSLGDPFALNATSYEDQRFPHAMLALPLVNRLGVSGPMRQALSRSSSEIIHTHGLWMLPNIYRSKRSIFVVSPRGMLSSVALSYSPNKKRLFRLLFQDRALSDAALLHATADSEYDDIRRFGLRQPVAVIPNGIDIPKIDRSADIVSRREVLSLGRIHKKKGLVSLISAWAEVCDEFPDWKLRIVGPDEGGHVRELEEVIKNLGLTSVSIEQPVFGDDKVRLMSSVDLFVLPTLSENFAMTVAESLSLGVPVIATKGAPWEGLQVHRCGWWVDHGSASLSASLRSALALTDFERRAMGERGRKWMSRDFSWERIAQMSVDAYLWLLGRGDRPDFVYEA